MRKPRTGQRKVVLSSSDDDCNSRPKNAPSDKAKPQTESPRAGKAKQNVITLLSSPTGNTASPPIRNKLESAETHSQLPSPRKSKGRTQSKPKAQALPKGKTLHSFFASASQAQSLETSGAPEQVTKVDDTLDSIQDEFLDNASDISTSTREGREDRRRYKRAHGNIDGYGEGLLSGSQKFRKISTLTTIGNGHTVKPSQTSDFQPWTDKYAPLNLSELAVHKRKVDEIRQWLNNVYCGRLRKSVLILRGPAGAGKSTSISLLAKDMGIQVQEWKSPSSSNYASESYSSATAQFDDFLNRAGKYGHLETEEKNIMDVATVKGASTKSDKQAIFVEEFPLSSLQGSSSALRAFRNSIIKYLATNTSTSSLTWKNTSTKIIVPLILLISESLLNCSSISDIFTAHRLFGAELLTHHGVTVIDFNPIAPTLLLKGLEVISRKEAVHCQKQKFVSQSLLKKLAESGDMRSAVSSLEFIYIQGNEDIFEGQERSSRPKFSTKSNALSSMEKETLEVVTQREMSLGLFHAVGKVVYNKRENASNTNEIPLPPTFMPENARPKASDVDFSTLIDELGTDVNTFVSALHENYILSCNAGSTEDTLDSVVGCIDSLSDTDLLLGKKDVSTRYQSSTGGGNSQSWRSQEILFNVATRGIVFSLPCPVRRSNTTKSLGKGRVTGDNAFKMYYPVSSRLWRQEEDYWDLLDLLVQKNQRGELRVPSTKAMTNALKIGLSGFADLSFRPKKDQQKSAAKLEGNNTSGKEPMGKQEQMLSSGNTSARYEMLLERIPYISLLHHARHSKCVYMKDLDRLARFTGIDDKGDELSESDDEVSGRTAIKPKRTVKTDKEGSTASAIAGLEDQTANRLVLSDDDIVDN